MNQWFRMYAEFSTDPKIRTMSDVLQIRLVRLFCLRSSGLTEKLSCDELKYGIGCNDDETFLETKLAFQAKGFIDENWDVLNWNKRQFVSDSSTERVNKFRAKQALKQDETFQKRDETKNETHQNRTEQNRTEKKKTPAPGKPSAECLTLYQAYPRHVAPAAAYRAIGKALQVKPFDYLIAAVNRYAKSVQAADPQYIAHPATWFNAGRYDDEPSALFPSGGKSNVGSDKNQPSPAKQRVDGARRVLAEIAISRGLYDPACADGRPDAQVPQPGPAGERR
jgi:hypothetical protein